MKIRWQLMALVLALLLPAGFAAGLLITYSYARQRAAIEQSALETARALGQAVDEELASGRTALQALATSPYLASGDLAAFHRQAREALRDLPGNNIVLSDASGQQLLNTLRPLGEPLPRHGNPAQLRRVFETGQPVVSDLYVGAVTQRLLVGIDVPVRRGDQVIYVLSLGFFPERLGDILSRESLPALWVSAILDSQGAIVARTLAAETHVGRQGPPAVIDRLAQSASGRVTGKTLEGVPADFVFSRSPVSGWSVLIAVPQALWERELRESIWWIVAGTVVLLGSGLLLAGGLSARIGRAVHGLIEPAKALARGEQVVVRPLGLREADEVAQALERACTILREREEILAVVTHDLRNPLSGVVLMAAAADASAANLPGGEVVRTHLALIRAAGQRMSGLVDDLLAVVVSGSQSMLKMAPVNAESLLADAVAIETPLFQGKGIELRTDAQAGLPPVQVDRDRIIRVFINLLDNALKFTDQGGWVVVRAQVQPQGVRFSIANAGPALSTTELERMFQPFWQAQRGDQLGAGLGLSICHSIVESHGGRIWAEPEAGMRVCVCFELPCAPQQHSAPARQLPVGKASLADPARAD